MCLIFQDTAYAVVHWSVINIRHLVRNTLEFKYLIGEINNGLMRIHKQLSLQGKQHWWTAVCQTVGSCSAWQLKMQFAVLSLQADSFKGIVRMRLDPTRKKEFVTVFLLVPCSQHLLWLVYWLTRQVCRLSTLGPAPSVPACPLQSDWTERSV